MGQELTEGEGEEGSRGGGVEKRQPVRPRLRHSKNDRVVRGQSLGRNPEPTLRLCRAMTQSEYTVYVQCTMARIWVVVSVLPLATPAQGAATPIPLPGVPGKSLRYPPDQT